MKVVASHAGGKDGHHVDERLEVLEMSQGNYVNVDTTTLHGLKKAKSLGLVQSKEVNAIFTPYVQEAAVLFDKNHRGRFVTILRDPVDQITSLLLSPNWKQRHEQPILGRICSKLWRELDGKNVDRKHVGIY